MSGFWSIIVPSQTAITNLVTNPSLETSTDGWDAKSGGTYSASTTRARRGYKSLAYTPTTNTTDGVFYDAVALASGTTYTAAFDFWGADTIPFTAYFATTAGSTVDDTAITWTASAQWTRHAVSYAATASANYRLYVTKNTNASTALFYVDGIGIYATSYDPGHIDGDQEDCYWTGTAHASTSVSRAGNRWLGESVNFDNYSFYVESWSGAGMPVVESLTQPISLLPGVQDYGEKVRERTFDIVGTIIGTSQTNLHYARQQLINAVKSDLVRDKQQFWLTFSGANSIRPTRIRAKYTGGLTFSRQEGFSERLGLRFQATNPLWQEDGTESAVLTTSTTVDTPEYLVERDNYAWSNVSSGFNGDVNAIVKGINGEIYIGGAFTDVGDANGDYVVKYTPSTGAISSLGTGMNGAVLALAVAPNGYLYAGGAFTLAGGVANTVRVAYWNGTAWNPLSTGIDNGLVYALAFGKDGKLYIGGTFANVGDASGDYITSWNGTAFASLGTGMDDVVFGLTIGKHDGYVYAGGLFGTAGGVTSKGMAIWNYSAWSAAAIPNAGGIINELVSANDGAIYAGGYRIVTDYGVAAIWNGSNWSEIVSMTSTTDEANALGLTDDGILYVGINSAYSGYPHSGWGGSMTSYLTLWNGSTLANPDAKLSGATAILADGNNLYIGCATADTYASVVTTVTNSGTAVSYPEIVFKRSGGTSAIVSYLRNNTTGATLWLDYALQDGETLTIDCSPGARSATSTFYGNVMGQALLRNSDLAEFSLLPGTNSISAFVYPTGSPTVTAWMTWPVTHWACDGSAT